MSPPPLRGIFIVGTDTDVGKTFVARALCRALRLRGRPVVGLKPYESGCTPIAQDAAALEREAQSGLALDLRVPFRYRLAVAPAVAAAAEGRSDSIADAVAIARQAARGRFAVIESAGGLASPIDGRRTNLDLARALRLPTLVVARNALGTLSQTALAIEALRRRSIPIAGLVLSRASAAADPSQATNLQWALQLSAVRWAIDLPRLSLARAAELLAPVLRLTPLRKGA